MLWHSSYVIPDTFIGRLGLCKDSCITQDRNEYFEGGRHDVTFSRGHSSLTWGTSFKNWVPKKIWLSSFHWYPAKWGIFRKIQNGQKGLFNGAETFFLHILFQNILFWDEIRLKTLFQSLTMAWSVPNFWRFQRDPVPG